MKDYHLSKKEQEAVEGLVPKHQAEIFTAFRCDLNVDGTDYTFGAVALSEHMVTVCKKGFIKGFKLIRTIHILDISYLGIPSEKIVKIEAGDVRLTIVSSEKPMKRFATTLFRNYLVVSQYFPINARFKFNPKNPDNFPPFDPKLSPSQTFQFCYNAYCSLQDSTYYHTLVQFVHYCVVTRQGIFDFSRIPLHDIESSFAWPLDFPPVFDALLYFPIIQGVMLKDVGRPDFLGALAPMVRKTTHCRIISIESAMIQFGIDQFAEAIASNRKLNLEYLDLSDNPFDDLTPLCASLGHLKGDLFFLDLSNCGMSENAVKFLIESMDSNHHLWGLRYINLAGAQIGADTVAKINNYMKALDAEDMEEFKSINFGSIKSGLCDLIRGLMKYHQPVQKLFIQGSKFDTKAEQELIKFISNSKTLIELDISNTGLKPEYIASVVNAFAENNALLNVSLHLTQLKLNGKRLDIVLDAIKSHPRTTWGILYFDQNGLQPQDIVNICKSCQPLTSIQGFSLNDNLTGKMKGLDDAFSALLNFSGLRYLSMKGGNNKIGPAFIPFLKALKKTTIQSFDPSFNDIGSDGLDALSDLIESSSTLSELYIDGSGSTDQMSLIRILDDVSNSKTLRKLKFPIDDVYNMMKTISKSKSKELYQILSDKQKNAQSAMFRNQTAAGFVHELSMYGIPELDELIDDIQADVNKQVEGKNLLEHSGINTAYSLPFPHLDEGVDPKIEQYGHGNDSYHLPELGTRVVESGGEAQLISTQLNSLCIQREKPKLNLKGVTMQMPTDFDSPQETKPQSHKSTRCHSTDSSSESQSNSSDDDSIPVYS